MPSLMPGLMAAACLWWMGAAVHAAPYAPTDDKVVVETLRQQAWGAPDAQRRLKRLKASWQSAARPDATGADGQAMRLEAATAYARAAIEQSRQEGDPRWLGAAQAALSPWWAMPAPPPSVRLLRATVLQSRHAFAESLADLDAMAADGGLPPAIAAQVLLTRASVLQVQGRWREAAADCGALAMQAPVESIACQAELASLQGHAHQAARTLDGLMRQASPRQAAWLALMRAELADRMGRAPEGEAFYRVALQGQADGYTLGAYADHLLDAGRPAQVVDLLSGHEHVDSLLLRLAMAWQAMGIPHEAQRRQAVADLQARFDAARLRGERVHLREEARFELVLRHRPQQAFELAQANWAVQKEPADVRLLMDAARAAGRLDVVAQMLDWVRRQGLVDVRLDGDRSSAPQHGRGT